MGECGIGCDQPRRADGSWEPEQSRRGDAAGERPVAVVWEDIKGRVVGLERRREGQAQRGQKAGHGGPCRHGQILGLSFKNID